MHQRVHLRVQARIVHSFGGSISAEHGLGQLRRDEAERLRTPAQTRLMRAVKAALDPQGVLNPGKVIKSSGS